MARNWQNIFQHGESLSPETIKLLEQVDTMVSFGLLSDIPDGVPGDVSLYFATDDNGGRLWIWNTTEWVLASQGITGSPSIHATTHLSGGTDPLAGSYAQISGQRRYRATGATGSQGSAGSTGATGSDGTTPTLHGFQTPPNVPASNTDFTNPFSFACIVTVYGGTTVALIVGGLSLGLASGTVVVPVGGIIKVTYVTPPSWIWFGLW